jgi:biopolymer transport protein ExbD
MPKTATFDVWFVTADQVYRGVPFQVVAGWVEQGRVSGNDQVRPAGAEGSWVKIGRHPLLRDYLPQTASASVAAPVAARTNATPTEPVEAPELELSHRKHADDDDDDVDMIPLIDVSLVLLVFFMMTTAAASNESLGKLAEVKSGAEINRDDPLVITVQMDLRESGEAFYALRVGTGRTIKPEDNNLVTLQEVKSRLDAILPQFTTRPEVRIACHQDVKHVRVRELVREIDPYSKKGIISGYQAEVNQKPE